MAVKVARIIADDEKSLRDPREVLFQTFPLISFLLLIFWRGRSVGGGGHRLIFFKDRRGPQSAALRESNTICNILLAAAQKGIWTEVSSSFWMSAALMVPNVVFTQSRWGCREASQARRREEKGKEAPGAPWKT